MCRSTRPASAGHLRRMTDGASVRSGESPRLMSSSACALYRLTSGLVEASGAGGRDGDGLGLAPDRSTVPGRALVNTPPATTSSLFTNTCDTPVDAG